MIVNKFIYKFKLRYLTDSALSNLQNEGLKKTIKRTWNYIKYGRGTLAPLKKIRKK